MISFTGQPIKDVHLLSPQVLAYIGDAVYELAVRRFLVTKGTVKTNQLHAQAVKYVRAGAQARVLFVLENMLSEEEKNIVRRGRNSKSMHIPKGAGVTEYRYSTAFECLIGYLYLKGDIQRLNEILQIAGDVISKEDKLSE